MWPNPQETADFVRFTVEIFMWGKNATSCSLFILYVLDIKLKTNIAAEETRIYSCDMRVKN